MGHVMSKSRSLGQILEKPFVHSRRHIFSLIIMKLCQNDFLDEIWYKFENGSCCTKFAKYGSIFSSTGHRPASLCHGPLSVVCPSVCASVSALTFSLNIFFSETKYQILMKFHRNVPTMVLFRIS